MGTPLYSVIIPTLNEEKFLPNLLDSLTSQSTKDFEVIVVDGSSRDKTLAVATSFKRKLPNLTVITSSKASLPLQRNLGAQKARGRWLAFVDADSVLLPYCFERFGQFIEKRKPKLFTSWFSPDRTKGSDVVLTLFGNLMIESSLLFKRPFAPGPLSVVYKKTFEDLGGYDEHQAFHEDMEFSMRAYSQGIAVQILRETLYIVSLRRLRQQGTFHVAGQYVRAALPVLLFKKPLRHMPGYMMGGHLYGKTEKNNR